VRLDILDLHQHVPDELLEAVHTVIYSAPLISEITELTQLNEQFAVKYGREYVIEIVLRGSPFLNNQVKYKLAVKQPDPQIVEHYLIGIIGPVEFEQHHHHHHHHQDSIPPPTNFGGNNGGMASFGPSFNPQPPIAPSFPNNNVQITFEPSAPLLGSSTNGLPPTSPITSNPPTDPNKPDQSTEKTSMDLDDLTARFEALRKKTHQ